MLCVISMLITDIYCMEVHIPPELVLSNMEVLHRRPVYSEKAARNQIYQKGWGIGRKAQYKEDQYLYER